MYVLTNKSYYYYYLTKTLKRYHTGKNDCDMQEYVTEQLHYTQQTTRAAHKAITMTTTTMVKDVRVKDPHQDALEANCVEKLPNC